MAYMRKARVLELADWLRALMGGRTVIARHEVITAYHATFSGPNPSKATWTRIKRAAGLISLRGHLITFSGSVTTWAVPQVLTTSTETVRTLVKALPAKLPRWPDRPRVAPDPPAPHWHHPDWFDEAG